MAPEERSAPVRVARCWANSRSRTRRCRMPEDGVSRSHPLTRITASFAIRVRGIPGDDLGRHRATAAPRARSAPRSRDHVTEQDVEGDVPGPAGAPAVDSRRFRSGPKRAHRRPDAHAAHPVEDGLLDVNGLVRHPLVGPPAAVLRHRVVGEGHVPEILPGGVPEGLRAQAVGLGTANDADLVHAAGPQPVDPAREGVH